MNNFKKYLPSKKFVSIILIIIVFIVLFFTIKGVISLFKNKFGNANSKGAPVPMTVGTIIQKDGNNNGVADWEESLWGLDPNKNGPENKEFIVAKKKSMEQNGLISTTDDSQSITQHDLLSRQFFATIMSLQQTGSLDDASISSISDSIGQEIKTTPIPDIYTNDMITIKKDSPEANTSYFNAFSALVDQYANQDIGSELTIVSQGIVNNDPQALYAAKTVASAYRAFGKDLIKIPVPSSAANTHLSLANNYEKTAQSIEGLTQVLTDPIVAMKSLLNYKKYSDALVSDIEKLSGILQ
jgi:hypothetical protein